MASSINTVVYNHSHSGFVNLPPSLVSILNSSDTITQNVIVSLEWKNPLFGNNKDKSKENDKVKNRNKNENENENENGNGNGNDKDSSQKKEKLITYVGWSGMTSSSTVIPSSSQSDIPSSSSSSSTFLFSLASFGKQSVQNKLSDAIIEIDQTFAESINLEEYSSVSVSLYTSSYPIADSVSLEPLTPSDWELIELHAQYLETNMLSQIRALHPNQILSVYVSSSSFAKLKVISIKTDSSTSSPLEFAKLTAATEVVIAPKVRQKLNKNRRSSSASSSFPSDAKLPVIPNYDSVLLRGIPASHPSFKHIPRTIRQKYLASFFYENYFNPDFNAYISENYHNLVNFNKLLDLAIYVNKNSLPPSLQNIQYLRLSIVRPQSSSHLQENDSSSLPIVAPAESSIVSVIYAADVPKYNVLLSPFLVSFLKVSNTIGFRVFLKPAPKPIASLPKTLYIYPIENSNLDSSSTQKTKQIKHNSNNKIKNAEIDADNSNGLNPSIISSEHLKMMLKTMGILNQPLFNGLRLPPLNNQPGFRKGAYLFFYSITDPKTRINPSIERKLDSDDLWAIFNTPSIDKLKLKILPTNSVKLVDQVNDFIPTWPIASTRPNNPNSKAIVHKLVGIDDILELVLKNTRLGIPTLLTASQGNGKTEILTWLSRQMYLDGIYVEGFKCSGRNNERISSIRDSFERALYSASFRAPALLILDDLDKLIPAISDESGEPSSESLRVEMIVHILIHLYYKVKATRDVRIIATSKSKSSINSCFFDYGRISFDFVNIPPPDKKLRLKMLEESMKEQKLTKIVSNDVDLIYLSVLMEGYAPNDINVLIDRVKDEAAVRIANTIPTQASNLLSLKSTDDEILKQNTEQEKRDNGKYELVDNIIMEDFDKAIKKYTPSSLRGVKLNKPAQISWSDIGGLKEVKQTLLETIEWPTKYEIVFSQSPLRLRQGLLLYGYPGCGKTMLAGAVARECGLNFISIKGPEILNKYIGASESAVRDLFARATGAKPCVLFFDEFDSIAPRRGHDSTGVTDRVVNQLLTVLDGAEGLAKGVYVLAATSRPDLIDPALLRPGRLDKSLLCDMPSVEDREDILRAITRFISRDENGKPMFTKEQQLLNKKGESSKINIDSRIVLKKVALATEGFTGADLQALMYNAYLEAAQEVLKLDKIEKKKELDKECSDELKEGSIDHVVIRPNVNKVHKKNETAAELEAYQLKLEKFNREFEKRNKNINDSFLPIHERKLEHMKETTNDQQSSDNDLIAVVKSIHIKHALQSTRASLPKEEYHRLLRIYTKFSNGRDANMPSGTASNDVGGRITLM